MSGVSLREAHTGDIPFMERRLYEATVPAHIPLAYKPSFEKAMTLDWIVR